MAHSSPLGYAVTVAVCVNCGAIKFGAFNYCDGCNFRPQTETDLAYSLALTDHYFAIDVLNQISADMSAGAPRPRLSPEQEEKFREAARVFLKRFGGLAASTPINKPSPDTKTAQPPSPPILGIRIHPSGSDRVTDGELVRGLTQNTPRSCRKAQDVIVAASRFLKGPSVFRSHRSLTQKLQKEIYELEKALLEEGYENAVRQAPVELLFFISKSILRCFPKLAA